jgi:hypothetical protein
MINRKSLNMKTGLLFFLAVSTPLFASDPAPLSKNNYQQQGSIQGVVMLQINWGRKWRCGSFENAQLEKLTFAGPSELVLTTPSRLNAADYFTPYAFVIAPGQYILTGYDVKVARSSTDVGHLTPDASYLAEDGGSFSVSPGEIVYIGHIGLDCAHDPMPWRYYIETSDEFTRYVAGFHKHFPFTANTPVTYRLMTTRLFGSNHSLEEGK